MGTQRPGSADPTQDILLAMAAILLIQSSRARVRWLPLLLLIAGPAIAQEPDSTSGMRDAPPAAVADSTFVSQDATDEVIRADLQAIFERVAAFEGIEVAVSAGVVRLVGEVPDRDAADRAVELAQRRENVVYVDDGGLVALSTGARLEDISSQLEEKSRAVLRLLPLLGVALVIVAVFAFLAWLVGRRKSTRLLPQVNPFLTAMLQRLLQFGLVVVGLVLALELLDATALVGAVVGTAGLAGLALGFAFKDIAENYLAGVILSLRQPFEKNDLIVVGGHEGKVVRMTGRETILMTPDGNHVQIPNATVFREPMTNFTRNPRRRFTLEIEVASDADLSEALDVGLAVMRDMRGVIDDPPPGGLVTRPGSGTVVLRFSGWVHQETAEFLRVRSEALRLIMVALEEAGIGMPSPEYRVALDGGGMVELFEGRGAGGIEAPVPDAATPESVAPPPTGAAEQRDVSVDRALDDQIEADRRREPADDLLK